MIGRYGRRWAVGLGLMLASTSLAAAGELCLNASEATAERVRLVQTELMVAALKCRADRSLAIDEKYNRFIAAYTPELIAQAAVLKDRFRRRFGAAYQVHLDRYITGLANLVSLRSLDRPGFCQAAAAAADRLLDAGDAAPATGDAARARLAAISQPFLVTGVTPACGDTDRSTGVMAGVAPAAAPPAPYEP